ncbi:hypothetical protein ACA910_004124 [Epithemia clementina (nom. ined.)]
MSDFIAETESQVDHLNESDIGEGYEEDAPVVVASDEISRRLGSSTLPDIPSVTSKSNDNTKKRVRYDSDDSADESKPPLQSGKNKDYPDYPRSSNGERRQRYDSDDDDDGKERKDQIEDSPQHKQRYDSSSDDSGDSADQRSWNRRSHSGSDEYKKNDTRTARSISGRSAGLQSGQDFAKTEERIQEGQRAQAKSMVDQHGMGETVYRKSSEKRNNKEKLPSLTKEQQRKINTGFIQQKQLEEAEIQFAKVQQSTFARGQDDAEIDDIRRNAMREGDPMAHRSNKRQESSSKSSSGVPPRLVYQGPSARPNRFGIRPGFRWDGNDRGNGFEDRLLARQASATQQREDAYRLSASGM